MCKISDGVLSDLAKTNFNTLVKKSLSVVNIERMNHERVTCGILMRAFSQPYLINYKIFLKDHEPFFQFIHSNFFTL